MVDSITVPGIAVIPVLIGPLQVLLAILPGILIALATALVSLFKPRVMWQLVKLLWTLKIQVALVIAMAFGIRWAVRHYRPQTERGAAQTAQVTAGTDWSLFRGGLQRTGASGTNAPPASGGVNWAVQKNERFYSSPAVVGNRVYVASVGELSPFDKEGVGRIYCFDASNGTVIWSATPSFKTGASHYRGTFASPVIKGSYLVCGEGIHVTKRCRVICLDLTPGQEGRLIWSHQTASHVECSPAIATVSWQEQGKTVQEDRVFVGAGDTDGYYCFDLKTGAVRWHLEGKDFPDAETSLTVHGNRVYAGQGNEGKSFSVIDAVSGKLIRKIRTPYPIFSPPAVSGGKLLVGMGNGDYVYSAADLKLPPHGEVWCVDLAKLETAGDNPIEPDWKVEAGETILGAVAVDGNNAYFCSANGIVYWVDVSKNGKILGTWNARDRVKASPAIAGGYVYVVAESGILHAVDRVKFEPAWTVQIGRGPLCISSPAIAHGRVYVGTEESGFVCAGEPAAPAKPVWTGWLGGPGRAGNASRSAPPESGQLKWNWPAEQDGSTATTNIVSPVAILGDRMFVAVAADAKGLKAGLLCVPSRSTASDGPGKALWHFAADLGVHESPSVAGDRVFFSTGRRGDANRKVQCLGAADGKARWEQTLADDVTGAIAATADGILLQKKQRSVSCMDHDGRLLWTAAVDGSMRFAPTVARGMVLAVTESPDGMEALDLPTGRSLWRASLGDAAVTAPAVDGDRVIFGTRNGVDARNILNGKPIPGWAWTARNRGGVSGEMSVDKEHIVYVRPDGALVPLDKTDGALHAAPLPGAMPGSTPVAGGGTVVFTGADGGLMCTVLDDSGKGTNLTLKAKAWLADTSALGKPSSPMVLSDGNIYAAWPGWGLLCLSPGK